MAIRALYSPSKTRIDNSYVRLLSRGGVVASHDATDEDDAQVVVTWPDVTLTIRFMDEGAAREHLAGFARYLREVWSIEDAEVLRRVESVNQVLGVVVTPGFDDEGRCETVLRGIAELEDALIFRGDGLYDARGENLAMPGSPPFT